MTRPEPFASVRADDLLLDSLAAHRDPRSSPDDRAAEALLRLARAADAAAGIAAPMTGSATGPSTGTDSRTTALAVDAPRPSASTRRQRHAVLASRLLVAAAASVALGLVPAAHDTRPPLPSPVLPAAPVALVRAQALVAEAQGLVAPPDAEPTTAGLDRAESLLAEASDVLDGVRDPVGGTLGVDAVRARLAGVAGALAAARHRLDSPVGVVESLGGAGAVAPTTPVAADRGSTRHGGASGTTSSVTRPAGSGSRHDGRDDSRDDDGGEESGTVPVRTNTSGSTSGHDASDASGSGHQSGTDRSSEGGGDDDPESDDSGSGTGSDDGTGDDSHEGSGDRSGDGSGTRSDDGSHSGSGSGSTGPGSGDEDPDTD
ncbi:hypothetical protein [Intrasporangium sp. YIM S08009]|uniref:hypothetical protein n=1 Tax=Intrasporangium zincisolvens TaxID=3080018 RepID=UPI002B053AC1|nr:hypothetical protein [Intrasporangium sp. YIM S08009]